jgi:hypothetical protein
LVPLWPDLPLVVPACGRPSGSCLPPWLAVVAEAGTGLAGDCCGRCVATVVAGHLMMTMVGDEQQAWEHGPMPSATRSGDFRP